ncbi:MAG: GCN5-related N-acetyltransferase [Ferruginibacter sp.]|nr:GCN5-related N-acetyltransferase [Ferruginibacter sp.]
MHTAQISVESLACIDVHSLWNCFNAAFKNYYKPVLLTWEQFADKLITEAIDLKLSFGIFAGDELVGFILNGVDIMGDQKLAYNTASGILPEYRGYKLSYLLYEQSIRELKKAGVNKVLLEVIEQNIAAKKIYEHFGFTMTRKLNSYVGKPVLRELQPIEIETLRSPDWDLIRKNCEWKPSWQYSTNCIKRAQSNYTLQVASNNKEPVAYCISNFNTGTVAHFGCSEIDSKEQYLSALFSQVTCVNNHQNTSVINVDTNALYANTFLLSIGLSRYFTSTEMELIL